jgi:hypothetical protein
MATKTRTTKAPAKARATSSKQRLVEEYVRKGLLEAAQKAGMAPAATQSAVVNYYLLIDFGFSSTTFQPNSVQFYSNTAGFLCSKLIDNASLASLVPILNCETVTVTWNTATFEAIHVYGYQPK